MVSAAMIVSWIAVLIVPRMVARAETLPLGVIWAAASSQTIGHFKLLPNY